MQFNLIDDFVKSLFKLCCHIFSKPWYSDRREQHFTHLFILIFFNKCGFAIYENIPKILYLNTTTILIIMKWWNVDPREINI